MLEIEKTPLETLMECRSNIISLDQDMLLSGFALFIEPDQASVRPKTDDIVVGVATDLPDDLKVSDLAEALGGRRSGIPRCHPGFDQDGLHKQSVRSADPDGRGYGPPG
jgi:hypothetical protein